MTRMGGGSILLIEGLFFNFVKSTLVNNMYNIRIVIICYFTLPSLVLFFDCADFLGCVLHINPLRGSTIMGIF